MDDSSSSLYHIWIQYTEHIVCVGKKMKFIWNIAISKKVLVTNHSWLDIKRKNRIRNSSIDKMRKTMVFDDWLSIYAVLSSFSKHFQTRPRTNEMRPNWNSLSEIVFSGKNSVSIRKNISNLFQSIQFFWHLMMFWAQFSECGDFFFSKGCYDCHGPLLDIFHTVSFQWHVLQRYCWPNKPANGFPILLETLNFSTMVHLLCCVL